MNAEGRKEMRMNRFVKSASLMLCLTFVPVVAHAAPVVISVAT